MPLLKPWRTQQGQSSADAVAVNGGLVIGLFRENEPLCYIVTDGERMHKFASVNSWQMIKPGYPLRWTRCYISLIYTWGDRMSMRGEANCRAATGMDFKRLCEHLDAVETAASYAQKRRQEEAERDRDVVRTACVLQMVQIDKPLPKTFYTWAAETMRGNRKRVMTAHVVRVGKAMGGPDHICTLQYEVRRTKEAICPVLRRIGICGPNIVMQLGKELSLCGWKHPDGWAIDKSQGKMQKGYIFPSREVRAEFPGTGWAHFAPWTQCGEGRDEIDPHAYALRHQLHGSVIERLTRAGMTRLAMEIENIPNPKSTDICGALKISKADMRVLRGMNAGHDDLSALRVLHQIGEQRIDAELIGFARDAHMHRMAEDEIRSICGTNVRKLLRWIIEQEEKHGVSSWQTVRWLTDGRRMERQLHVPPIEWPRDVRAWHDTLANMQKAEDAAKHNAAIAMRAAALEHTAGTVDGIMIRPLRSGMELFEEGKALEHCVASYAEKYAQGRCEIYCARLADAPDVPLVTFEMRGGEIAQIQGRKDRIATPDEKAARAAVVKWAQTIKRKEAAD